MVCPNCTSMYVKKDGKKKRTNYVTQRYKCNSCKKSFSIPLETALKNEYPSVEPGEIFKYKTKDNLRVHCFADVDVGANEFDFKNFKVSLKVKLKYN